MTPEPTPELDVEAIRANIATVKAGDTVRATFREGSGFTWVAEGVVVAVGGGWDGRLWIGDHENGPRLRLRDYIPNPRVVQIEAAPAAVPVAR